MGWLEEKCPAMSSGKVLRQPPRIKVLEALGAIGDGRVERLGPHRYRVRSSDGSRVYLVYVDPARGLAYSNDNGTRLRGYIGYPIIAALMLEGVLPLDRRLAEALRGIPWKQLNEKYKKYAVVERIVKREAASRGVDPGELDRFTSKVMEALRGLRLRMPSTPPLDLAATGGSGGERGDAG